VTSIPAKHYIAFLASLDVAMLQHLRHQLASWVSDPLNVYGVTVDGRMDLAWDQTRLELVDAELKRRGHPTDV
jgi:hypothetical protein